MGTDRLMTIQEVAEYLGISIQTLYHWRSRGEGPLGVKVGGQVRYESREVRRWLEDQRDPRPAAR